MHMHDFFYFIRYSLFVHKEYILYCYIYCIVNKINLKCLFASKTSPFILKPEDKSSGFKLLNIHFLLIVYFFYHYITIKSKSVV